METITSRTNPLIAHIRKLTVSRKTRRSQGLMVCEGPKMLGEALRWGATLDTILWEAGAAPVEGIPPTVRQVTVPGDLLRSVAPTQTPQQVLFLCALPDHALPAKLSGSRYLVLDNLQDPGNLGTLWRTADAFGADGLILLPGCADPWGPKTLRATMGACFRLPVWEGTLEELLPRLQARRSSPLYAAALREDTEDIRTVSPAPGGGGHWQRGAGGVPPGAGRPAEETLQIPMRGPVRVPQCRGRRYGGTVADGIRRLTNRKERRP